MITSRLFVGICWVACLVWGVVGMRTPVVAAQREAAGVVVEDVGDVPAGQVAGVGGSAEGDLPAIRERLTTGSDHAEER